VSVPAACWEPGTLIDRRVGGNHFRSQKILDVRHCAVSQAVLQQVSGRTVLLDNRADDVGRQRQAGAFLAVVDGLLSGSQLGSFLAPGWAVDAAAEAPPAAAGALRAHIDGGLPEDAATIAAGVGADSRCGRRLLSRGLYH